MQKGSMIFHVGTERILVHHGVKGMKWGVRKSPEEYRKQAAEYRKKTGLTGMSSLDRISSANLGRTSRHQLANVKRARRAEWKANRAEAATTLDKNRARREYKRDKWTIKAEISKRRKDEGYVITPAMMAHARRHRVQADKLLNKVGATKIDTIRAAKKTRAAQRWTRIATRRIAIKTYGAAGYRRLRRAQKFDRRLQRTNVKTSK